MTRMLTLITGVVLFASSCNLLFRNTGIKIEVTPQNSVMQPGATLELKAFKTNLDGSMENVSGTVSWTSSNTNVLIVSSNGLVEAIARGFGAIGASLYGESGSAMITVSDPDPTAEPKELEGAWILTTIDTTERLVISQTSFDVFDTGALVGDLYCTIESFDEILDHLELRVIYGTGIYSGLLPGYILYITYSRSGDNLYIGINEIAYPTSTPIGPYLKL